MSSCSWAGSALAVVERLSRMWFRTAYTRFVDPLQPPQYRVLGIVQCSDTCTGERCVIALFPLQVCSSCRPSEALTRRLPFPSNRQMKQTCLASASREVVAPGAQTGPTPKRRLLRPFPAGTKSAAPLPSSGAQGRASRRGELLPRGRSLSATPGSVALSQPPSLSLRPF